MFRIPFSRVPRWVRSPGLSPKFLGNYQLFDRTPQRFLFGITENSGEFRIDPQNAVIRVEQNDGFTHCRKQFVEQGFLPDEFAAQRNFRAYPIRRHSVIIALPEIRFQLRHHNAAKDSVGANKCLPISLLIGVVTEPRRHLGDSHRERPWQERVGNPTLTAAGTFSLLQLHNTHQHWLWRYSSAASGGAKHRNT